MTLQICPICPIELPHRKASNAMIFKGLPYLPHQNPSRVHVRAHARARIHVSDSI